MAENAGFSFAQSASPTKLTDAQDRNADSPQEWTLKAHSGTKIPRPAASTPVGQRILAKVPTGNDWGRSVLHLSSAPVTTCRRRSLAFDWPASPCAPTLSTDRGRYPPAHSQPGGAGSRQSRGRFEAD